MALTALTDALGRKVGSWTAGALNWQQTVRIGANNEIARVVLLRMISGFHWKDPATSLAPLRYSWSLTPNIGLGTYAFAMRQVFVERPGRSGQTVDVPIRRTGPLNMNQSVLPILRSGGR